MTGNTKIWRAPLAGLASVAMLATMGVATATANAATTVKAADTVEVTVKIGNNTDTVTLTEGMTYADAVASVDFGGPSSVFPPRTTTMRSTPRLTTPRSAASR